jgi:hypothetical protein
VGLDTLFCGADFVVVFVEEVVCLWFFGFVWLFLYSVYSVDDFWVL